MSSGYRDCQDKATGCTSSRSLGSRFWTSLRRSALASVSSTLEEPREHSVAHSRSHAENALFRWRAA